MGIVLNSAHLTLLEYNLVLFLTCLVFEILSRTDDVPCDVKKLNINFATQYLKN